MDEKTGVVVKERLATAVSQFFDKVAEDPLLQLYFHQTDMEALKPRFCAYLGHLLADTEVQYRGVDILKAHAGRQIMDEAADSFAEKLLETLREAGVSSADVKKVERKFADLKNLVVDKFVSPDTHVYKPERMG